MNLPTVDFSYLLPSVEKPARYIDHEVNARAKTPTDDSLNFCLAFPDAYEVGFSHLGLKILYSILNDRPGVVADRCYAPWQDFADLLREERIPLFGLESRVALKRFDVVGFTLQSELTLTNVLYMLDLAEIPLLASERTNDDPIVLAGGPAVSNPEPMSRFFDAIVIGEAEEVIGTIADVLKQTNGRTERLKKLASIPSVYVPSMPEESLPVQAAKFTGFSDSGLLHTDQLVPWLQPAHDRYVEEIMRGCTRGCRFCHAGFFYRPVREKSPDAILERLVREVETYGWEEAGLSSLSSSDYTCIRELMPALYERLGDRTTSLSLPSLRVDTLDEKLVRLMNFIGAAGLTIAPEAGTQRLRDIINKNITEADILHGCRIALDNGWKLIKLYFMIGLPFETDEDVMGIVDVVEKINALSRKRLKINISLSPFVPKPFTPFQWAQMQEPKELLRRIMLVKHALKPYKNVRAKYPEVESSILEGVLSRGDASLGDAILEAYREGAIFDGWTEMEDTDRWMRVFDRHGSKRFLDAIPLDRKLPWDFIDLRIDRQFLKDEWRRASEEVTTGDCREIGCYQCGVCDGDVKPVYSDKVDLPEAPQPIARGAIAPEFYRLWFEQTGDTRFVGHLDLLRMLQRVLRSSGLPIVHTEGFNPHPRVALGPPLPVGVESFCEYVDFALDDMLSQKDIATALQKAMPGALGFVRIEPVPTRAQRAMNFYRQELVEVTPPESVQDIFPEKLAAFNQMTEFLYDRTRKGKTKTVDIKSMIESIEWENGKLTIVKLLSGISVFEILDRVFGIPRDQTGRFRIVRLQMIK